MKSQHFFGTDLNVSTEQHIENWQVLKAGVKSLVTYLFINQMVPESKRLPILQYPVFVQLLVLTRHLTFENSDSGKCVYISQSKMNHFNIGYRI